MELYYFESCPYCVRVLDFLTGKSHDITMKDTANHSEFREELKAINNGITQVPCLVIEGRPMLESLDIIEYLKGILSA